MADIEAAKEPKDITPGIVLAGIGVGVAAIIGASWYEEHKKEKAREEYDEKVKSMGQDQLLQELASWSMRLDQKASSLETLGYMIFMVGMMSGVRR